VNQIDDRGKEMTKCKETGAQYERCVVTFIDVLGFRELVNNKSADEVLKVITTLERFSKPEDEPAFTKMKYARLQSEAFANSISDAILRVRPYDTQARDGAFFYELHDLLFIQVQMIESGILIRAGVSVGDAHVGLVGQGPVFGPAMIRAYEIESGEAIYPRIVVDEEAYLSFLNDPQLRSDTNTFKDELKFVDDLLAIGEDGTRFIDYLRAIRHEIEDVGSYLEFLEHHAKLIEKGQQEKDRRVRRKYEWMARYHNSVVDELLKEEQSTMWIQNEFDHEEILAVALDVLQGLKSPRNG
jgi:hypothetical protein